MVRQKSNKLLIVSDMDGVICKKQKVWFYRSPNEGRELTKAKAVCDRDQHIARQLGEQMVFISGDPDLNRELAARWQVPFIFSNTFKGDKYDDLCSYWSNVLKIEGRPRYAYIGDSMPDLKCMREATMAYAPNDASILLRNALMKSGTYVRYTKASSGEGVLEEAVDTIVRLDPGWTKEELNELFGI